MESKLGALGTATTYTPIMPALSDYVDGEMGGMMIGKGNRSTRRKLLQCRFVHHKPHMPARTRNRAAAVGSQRLTA
jgi:hypothetical protein